MQNPAVTEELIAAFRRDDERNGKLYTDLLRTHGDSHKALNWRSEEAQRTRFMILAEIGIAETSSVLDVGCGIGDFLAYLRSRGYRGAYCGIDLASAMVGRAKERFPDASFNVANLLDDQCGTDGDFDFVVASGIFYRRSEEPFLYLSLIVRRMFDLCRVGTAFNSLSTYADQPGQQGEFRADPLEVLDACRRMTPFVALCHDYHLGDFSIYMRRSARLLLSDRLLRMS